MNLQTRQFAKINGVKLEFWDKGSGEPIVFIHGSMGDECFAELGEPALVNHYRLIHYHRRGYGGSECPEMPVSISQQWKDCKALLQHLGVERAHFVGQSYGGLILLQLALEAPEVVHTLALLEPALPSVLFNSPDVGVLLAKVNPLYESGDKAGAIETFGRGVAGPGYRKVFDQTLPTGYFDRWVADADTIFQSDMPAMQPWKFTPEDATRITQPTLNVRGENTAPFFREIYETVETLLPHAENFVLPNATHAMLQMNPKGIAKQLTGFFSKHSLLVLDR